MTTQPTEGLIALADIIAAARGEALEWARLNHAPYAHDIYVAQVAIDGTLALIERRLRASQEQPHG